MRKKINEEELMEDEKIIPAEENNCFAFDEKCEIYNTSKMSKQDKVNCGTIKCPFYKPRGMENCIKYVSGDDIRFQTFEEFKKETGIDLIKIENIKDYENLSHASAEEVDKAYFKYVKENKCFEILTAKELKDYAAFIDVPINGLRKKEIVSLLKNIS